VKLWIARCLNPIRLKDQKLTNLKREQHESNQIEPGKTDSTTQPIRQIQNSLVKARPPSSPSPWPGLLFSKNFLSKTGDILLLVTRLSTRQPTTHSAICSVKKWTAQTQIQKEYKFTIEVQTQSVLSQLITCGFRQEGAYSLKYFFSEAFIKINFDVSN
jgi:hypothetical protein